MIMVKYSGCKRDIILGKEPQNILKIMRMKSLNKIAIAFVAILVNMLLSCSSNCRNYISNEDSLAVDCSIFYIFDNFMEDSLQQRENCNKDRRITLELKLKNNSSINKYTPFTGLSFPQYNSRIGFYVNGVDISGIYLNGKKNRILAPHDSTYVKLIIVGASLKRAGLRENIPLRELLTKIHLHYDKDERDTVFSKYPISDMNIMWSKNLIIEYLPYEHRNTFID